jgi:hypothetical protein
MAISLRATSERLLRGVDRMVASLASMLPVGMLYRRARLSRAWSDERGSDILIAQVDVAGGFPGSLRWQQRLAGSSIHLTDRWLIVGEGMSNGFALPLDRLAGSAVQSTGGLKPPSLTLWYHDGDLTGSFSLNFRGTARGRSGLMRADVWQQQLVRLGVPKINSEQARFSPEIHVEWDDIADFADDDVLYSGRAWASVGGPFGAELDTADVWITGHALIWCPAHGQGLNRLALESVIEARGGFGDRVAIGIEDACGGRYDLFFDFGNRNDRTQRGAHVQELLAAAGVRVSSAAPVIAPWRRGGTRPPVDS